MNDRLVGVFEDEETARRALEALVSGGVGRERLRVDRVLEQDHRGLGESERVHSLIHAPIIEDDDPVADDAGTVILVVDLDEPGEGTDSPGAGSDRPSLLAEEMEGHGATKTMIVEGTPGLDL